MKWPQLFVYLCLLCSLFSCQKNIPIDMKALQDTQKMLIDPVQREALKKQDSNFKKSADKLEAALKNDPALNQQVYELFAAEVYPYLLRKFNGDTQKLQAYFKALPNGLAFKKDLPPEMVAKLDMLFYRAQEKAKRVPATVSK